MGIAYSLMPRPAAARSTELALVSAGHGRFGTRTHERRTAGKEPATPVLGAESGGCTRLKRSNRSAPSFGSETFGWRHLGHGERGNRARDHGEQGGEKPSAFWIDCSDCLKLDGWEADNPGTVNSDINSH